MQERDHGDACAPGIGIEVKVTDRCNQSCFHCVNRDAGASGMQVDHRLVIARLREWGRSTHPGRPHIEDVRLTGGEPLLNVEGVADIVRCCSDLGLRSGINTNGSLITREVAGSLRLAGMSVMKISLDAVTEEVQLLTRGSSDSLAACLKGISVAVEAGFEVIARFTLSRLNDGQLLPCYRFARDAGVAKFQVKPLIDVGRATGCGQFLEKAEIRSLLARLAEQAECRRTVPEILCWPPDDAFGMQAKACGSINKIYVATDGRVTTCNFLRPTWEQDLSMHSLEEIVRDRTAKVLPRNHCGFRILDGCPHYFEAV